MNKDKAFGVVFKTLHSHRFGIGRFEDGRLEAWRCERCHDDSNFKVICEL